MSARVFSAGQGVDQLPIDNVNYEESETNNNETSSQGESKPPTTRRNPMKKRASVQSNLSRVSSNGQLCSGPNSGSSQAGDEDEEEEEADDVGGQQQMSNEEYERIRNTTLLFFLDRLCMASHEGKEARTLHDLSCLFGTREFTKEMRQIVGASRNGLKKFLQSYPSLFQIEDDKVYLTQLNGGAGSQVTKRDYNGEAVDYFKQKLLQFGSSLVPIKNLFGYRSQASQEVRHVSGKNSRDFKRFLKQNDDVFEILADEHVVLRSALRELESQGLSSLSLQQSLQPVPADEATTLDPYLNKQLAHLIEDCIRRLMSEQQPPVKEDQFRVTLEKLYEIIREQCQNELFLKMVKSLEDLKVFLRMHPKLFKRIPIERTKDQQQESQLDKDQASGNPLNEAGACYYVGLVSESERREQELQAFRATNLLARQMSTPEAQNTSTNSTSAETKTDGEQSSKAGETIQKEANSNSAQATISASNNSNNNCNNKQQEELTSNKKRLQHPLQASLSVESKSRPCSSNQTASNRLRANAPPFVPSARTQHTSQRLAQHQLGAGPGTKQSQMMMQRQSSLLTQGYRSQRAPNEQQPDARTQMRPEPIQRSVSNLSSPLRSLTNGGGGGGGNYHEPVQARELPPPLERRPAIRGHMGEQQNNNWVQQTQQQAPTRHSKLQPLSLEAQLVGQRSNSTTTNATLASQEDLRARTVDIVREASNIIAKIMTTTDAVAFDCKGYNLGFDGKITLIQFGFLPQKNFDPMQLANSMNKRFASTAPTLTAANRDTNGLGDKEKVANGAGLTTDGGNGASKEIKPEVCVFDLITNPELAYCLKPLLESDKIVKIVHDVRNKSNALHVQFSITLNNVFDTQVANLVIQQQITGKPAYKSRYISMGKLCEVYGGENLVKYRDMIRIKTSSRGGGGGSSISRSAANSLSLGSSSSKDVNYWRSRPLTRAMVLEATMDVYCLIGGIYQNLKGQIKPEYKPLFDLLNLEGVLARIKPDEIRSAKKERKIDMEVIDLKRKLYSDSTGPVVLSNREIRLLRHIDLTEGVRQKIQQCKKVAKKIERLDMKAALLAQQQSETGEPNSLASPGSSSSTTNGTDGASREGQVDGLDQRQEQLQARLDEFNAAVKMMEDNSMFDEFKERLNESTSLLESLENDDDDDDDDEAAVQLSSGHHSHNGSSINDCCRCQCHSNQNSLESGASVQQPGEATATNQDKHPPELAEASGERLQADASKSIQEAQSNSDSNSHSNSQCIMNDSRRKSMADDQSSSTPSDSKQSDSRDERKDVAPIKQDEANNSLTGSEASDGSKSSACDMAVQCDLLS